MIRFSVNLDPLNNITRVKSFPSDIREINIGREKDCELRLKHDSLSRRHCVIKYIDNHYTVEDLGSSYGTFVNGLRLEPQTQTDLKHNDTLLLGDLEISIAILEEQESPEDLNDAAHEAVANLLGNFVQSAASDTTAYIKILNGEDEGTKFLLVDNNSWTIGRNEDANFIIHNPAISRHHAQITLKEGRYFLEDLDSQHGCEINGQKINGIKKLVHLDRLKMGPVKAIFFDPSMELLSALEYVQQRNEASETKAVSVTIPPVTQTETSDDSELDENDSSSLDGSTLREVPENIKAAIGAPLQDVSTTPGRPMAKIRSHSQKVPPPEINQQEAAIDDDDDESTEHLPPDQLAKIGKTATASATAPAPTVVRRRHNKLPLAPIVIIVICLIITIIGITIYLTSKI